MAPGRRRRRPGAGRRGLVPHGRDGRRALGRRRGPHEARRREAQPPATSGTRSSRRSPRRAPSPGRRSIGTGAPNPTWNIQGILQVPIWDGGTRYGNLRNARAAEDIAAQQLESLRRQAIIQVEQARRQLVVAEQSALVAKDQRDLAAQNDQMTQLAYQTGQGTSLELVTASEAHRQAELNLALAEFTVVKARLLAMLALATCPW